jgi:predicted phage-related endonuclease
MDLSEDLSLCGDFDELIDIREKFARLEQRESALKQRIQETMGDASKAVFASGEVSWKRSQDSTVLDSKKLLQEHPELLNQFSTIRAGSRRFLIRT